MSACSEAFSKSLTCKKKPLKYTLNAVMHFYKLLVAALVFMLTFAQNQYSFDDYHES